MVLLGSLCLLQLHVFTQCIPTSPGSAHSFSVEVLLMAFLGWQEGCCPFRNGWSPFLLSAEQLMALPWQDQPPSAHMFCLSQGTGRNTF